MKTKRRKPPLLWTVDVNRLFYYFTVLFALAFSWYHYAVIEHAMNAATPLTFVVSIAEWAAVGLIPGSGVAAFMTMGMIPFGIVRETSGGRAD